MTLKRLLGFFGLAAVISLVYFLVLPAPAQASEPLDQDVVQADMVVAQSMDDYNDNLDEAEAMVVDNDDEIFTGDTAFVEPEAEVRLSQNDNPFGRTNTMGGRR